MSMQPTQSQATQRNAVVTYLNNGQAVVGPVKDLDDWYELQASGIPDTFYAYNSKANMEAFVQFQGGNALPWQWEAPLEEQSKQLHDQITQAFGQQKSFGILDNVFDRAGEAATSLYGDQSYTTLFAKSLIPGALPAEMLGRYVLGAKSNNWQNISEQIEQNQTDLLMLDKQVIQIETELATARQSGDIAKWVTLRNRLQNIKKAYTDYQQAKQYNNEFVETGGSATSGAMAAPLAIAAAPVATSGLLTSAAAVGGSTAATEGLNNFTNQDISNTEALKKTTRSTVESTAITLLTGGVLKGLKTPTGSGLPINWLAEGVSQTADDITSKVAGSTADDALNQVKQATPDNVTPINEKTAKPQGTNANGTAEVTSNERFQAKRAETQSRNTAKNQPTQEQSGQQQEPVILQATGTDGKPTSSPQLNIGGNNRQQGQPGYYQYNQNPQGNRYNAGPNPWNNVIPVWQQNQARYAQAISQLKEGQAISLFNEIGEEIAHVSKTSEGLFIKPISNKYPTTVSFNNQWYTLEPGKELKPLYAGQQVNIGGAPLQIDPGWLPKKPGLFDRFKRILDPSGTVPGGQVSSNVSQEGFDNLARGLKPGEQIPIGRANLAGLPGDVSNQHAVLGRATDGKLYIMDTGSKYGTSLNGKPIPTKQWIPIQPGQKLKFGPQMEISVNENWWSNQPAKPVINPADDFAARQRAAAQAKLKEEARRKAAEKEAKRAVPTVTPKAAKNTIRLPNTTEELVAYYKQNKDTVKSLLNDISENPGSTWDPALQKSFREQQKPLARRILGTSENATAAELKKKYYGLVTELSQDKNMAGTQAFYQEAQAMLNLAYSILAK